LKLIDHLLLFLFFTTTIIWSQDVYKQNINTNHGLPSNTVYDIVQDKNGFLWIATKEGITRFDGTRFKEFKSKELNSVVGSHISIDARNTVWYETFDGFILYVEKDSLKTFEQKQPIGFVNYAFLNDKLYYLSENHINTIDIKTKKPTEAFNLMGFTPNYIQTFNDEIITFEGEKRIVKIKNNATLISNLNSETVKSPIHFQAFNKIYFADKSNKNPNFYSIQNSKTTKEFEIITDAIIQNIEFFDELFWVCTNNGLIVLDKNGRKLRHILKKHSITSLIKDQDQIFWIGTHNDGIFKIESFDEISLNLSVHKPLKIAIDANQLIIGNEFGELLTSNLDLENLSKTTFKGKNEIGLINTENSKYNFIVSDGLIQTDKKFNVVHQDFYAVKSLNIINEQEIAFAATGFTGFKKIDSFHNIKSAFGSFDYDKQYYILQKNVRGKVSAHIKKSKSILFATNQGLSMFQNNSFTSIKHNNKPLFIRSISALNDEAILASSDDKLFHFKNGEINKIDLKIEKISFLKSFGNELFLISKNQVYQWNNNTFIRLDLGISEKINDFEITKNSFYVLVDKHLMKINKQKNIIAEKNIKLIIENITVNGQNVDSFSNEIFNHNQNNIEIAFSKIDFNSFQNPVVYKINDSKWIELNNVNILRLASLSPNQYKVQIQVKNHNETLQTINFTIQKPFWLQVWFFLLIILSGILIFMSIYKYRFNLLSKKKNLEIEKITLENHLNENRLKLIKAQMNPHFFFNALNTIQSFIATNETDEATSYLDNFSKLTRLILEMTDKNSISIEEEINMQKLYLNLQKIRLNNFCFEIVSEPESIEKAQIPTMLIQPFVENAIIHGLSHKKGQKFLKIQFLKTIDEKLEIIIRDNGIGIKKANEINSKSKTKSASFATKATLERLEIINRNNITIAIETNEIVENEISQGTEVKIKMNLAYESL